MRSLSRSAQCYLFFIYLVGLAAAFFAYTHPGPKGSYEWWELGIFLIVAVLASGKKVQLIRGKVYDRVGSMSLGFAITFAALLRFGIQIGVLIAALSCLSGCLYPKRQPIYQLLFNVSLTSTTAWVAGHVFVALNNGGLNIRASMAYPAIMAASLTYFALNTGGVAAVIALCSGEKFTALWRRTFLWTAPSYFAGASISLLALYIFGDTLASVVLFGAPVAYLTYQSHAVYMDREEKKQAYIEELQNSQARLADLYLATIESLALAIDAKDQYTHQHILRVQRYALATAEQMHLGGDDLDGLRTGALLHDIGKLGVPEYVLLKPGRLTDEEFAKIKKHPEIGAAILDPVDFPWPVLPVVKYHHERWDGSGYPEGLKGENIPLTARILAVADVYDALTSTRSYRKAMTHEAALEAIRSEVGTHFDPIVVNAFIQVIQGVVEEMAREGTGPLIADAQTSSHSGSISKADQAVREIQRASSELSALYEVAQTLSSSLGLEETLDILVRKLRAILPEATCLVLLKEKESPGMRVRAVVGTNHGFFLDSRTLNENSISLHVAQRQATYIGPYDPEDLMLSACASEEWSPLRSALIVPVDYEGELLGTINLYHARENAFGPHDRHLMETIAERVAMALYNSLLFDRTHSNAFTDPLTGLYNLRYLTKYVETRCRQEARRDSQNGNSPSLAALDQHAVVSATHTPNRELEPISGQESRAKREGFALLFLDLDSFKPINDNFGHQKGDQVLHDLSAIFRKAVEHDDLVARYGGDEFLIVLQGMDAADAERMAATVQEAVRCYEPGLHHPKLGALRLGVSVGYACYPEDGKDCASLLSAADARMYANKTERKLGHLADRSLLADVLAVVEDVETSESSSNVIYLKGVSAR